MSAIKKLFALGTMGAAAYGVSRMFKQRPANDASVDQRFDTTDVHDISEIADTTDVQAPIVVTEEVVVISEAGPYDVDLELIPADLGKQNS